LRKQGRAERKFFATESVTENKPLHRQTLASDRESKTRKQG
jgi:hypothetical protein